VVPQETLELYILSALQYNSDEVTVYAQLKQKNVNNYKVGFIIYDSAGKQLSKTIYRNAKSSIDITETITLRVPEKPPYYIALFAEQTDTKQEQVGAKVPIKTVDFRQWRKAADFPFTEGSIQGYCFPIWNFGMDFYYLDKDNIWKKIRHFLENTGENTWFVFEKSGIPIAPRNQLFNYVVSADADGIELHGFWGGGYFIDKYTNQKKYYTEMHSVSLGQYIPNEVLPSDFTLVMTHGYEAFFYQPNNGHKLFKKFFLEDIEPKGQLENLGSSFEHFTTQTKKFGYILSTNNTETVLRQFDPKSYTTIQKANFPGTIRKNAVFWGSRNYLYYGLGNNINGVGLDDLWQYNERSNTWRKIGDYPGAGNSHVQVVHMGPYALLFLGNKLVETSIGTQKLLPVYDTWFLRYEAIEQP
jgi:hypothetical protein